MYGHDYVHVHARGAMPVSDDPVTTGDLLPRGLDYANDRAML